MNTNVETSDTGIKSLSTRMKQNIQSARELALFMKRRAAAEDDQAKTLQRLGLQLQESFQRKDTKQGTFALACGQASMLQVRTADCCLVFAKSCSDISDELQELSKENEKTRKSMKENATRSDKLVSDAESARDKAKNKLDGLREEWERSFGSETQKKSGFLFKSNRTSLSPKQTEELKTKLDAADADWNSKRDFAARSRLELQNAIRPKQINEFFNLIRESDAILTLQLQRYARLLEDLCLSNATMALPINAAGGIASIISQISNEADLSNYLQMPLGSHQDEAKSASNEVSNLGLPTPVQPSLAQPSSVQPSLVQPNNMQTPSAPIRQARRHTGVPLETLLLAENGSVPNLVRCCCELVEQHGLQLEGLYRISGSTAAVEAIWQDFDSSHDLPSMYAALPADVDIHSIASVMKQFFRELPDALIPASYQAEFIGAARTSDEHQRRIVLHQIINDLPDANYSTLRYVILHLKKVEMQSATNLMTCNNLSIIFGPTLCACSNISDNGLSSIAIECVLQNCHLIFDDTTD